MDLRRQHRGFTPEAIENIRHRYVETDETQDSIAKDFNVTRKTIDRLADREGWPKRKDRAARDLPPDLKLKLEAEKAVRAEVEGAAEAVSLSIVDRLERAVEKELAAVEMMRTMLGLEPSPPADAERTARTLERLTETLSKVRRLRVPDAAVANQAAVFDMPKDIDEFRHALAFRIEAFVRSRRGKSISDGGESDGANSSE